MQLREYGRILRRYIWLIGLLPLLAGAFSLLFYEAPSVTYSYALEYSISFLPIELETLEQDPRLGAVQASEYVADDLTRVLRGTTFAGFVQKYLPTPLPVDAIIEATRAEKIHRLITINLSAGTMEEAAALGAAVKQALANDLAPLLRDAWGSEARLRLIDDSGPVAAGGGLRSQLDVPLRVALALVAAIALAFALDFLDDSVRSRDEAERLVGRVLGEIPK